MKNRYIANVFITPGPGNDIFTITIIQGIVMWYIFEVNDVHSDPLHTISIFIPWRTIPIGFIFVCLYVMFSNMKDREISVSEQDTNTKSSVRDTWWTQPHNVNITSSVPNLIKKLPTLLLNAPHTRIMKKVCYFVQYVKLPKRFGYTNQSSRKVKTCFIVIALNTFKAVSAHCGVQSN